MPAERFEFEDFELDRSAYELRRAGTVVHLERIPLELLFVLIERRGQLVTRQEIFERIWGKGVFVDTDNSINTAVNKIRRALNDDAEKPRFVVTVPARGYRFIAPIREESPTAPTPEANPVAAVADASPISAVAEANPTADAAVETSPITITKADMPLRKDRRRGILWSIGGIALIIAVIVVIEQLSLRPRTTTASFPRTQSPALPLPDKPSIAVLPFTNMSDDPKQEYFSDGITEDLITALSKLPVLFVIARNSTFTYKGKAVNVQQVGRELGVQYVLEGSVRKADNRVRVTAQLADATTGDHLWAERYDGPLQDIFAVQDSIVQRIMTTLNLEFTLVHQGWQFQRHTDNPEAYDDVLRGLVLLTPTKEGNLKARQMFEKAIELDPKYASAYADLGFSYLLGWISQWSPDPHTLDRAFQLEQQAIALDDSLASAHRVLAETYLYKKQYDEATAEAERVIALDPNSAAGYNALAQIMDFSGKPAEVIGLEQKAIRLDPRNQDYYLFWEATAYTLMGRCREAIPIIKRALARYPDNLAAHAVLVVDYTELGREDEARAEAAEVLRISPHFSLERWREMSPQKDKTVRNRSYADLRKAGLK
jgi:TolB-like protein/DNA-binding winged helix-turn-helix (wHTH) protein/tetratricopeptide (TPR) repeat protein